LIIFHGLIIALNCNYVKWLQYPCAQAPQKERRSHPLLKRRGARARHMRRALRKALRG
jgi:hypothetical protein